MTRESDEIDLGSGCALVWHESGQTATVFHPHGAGSSAWRREHFSRCHAGFSIGPNQWTLVQREPLTIEPSLLCGGCGWHAFIRNGKVVLA